MEIPAILKGEVHLPLVENMTAGQAIEIANAFYQTTLKPEDFKEAQAIVDGDKVILDLLDPATGEVLVHFVNKAGAVRKPLDNTTLVNPMAAVVNADENIIWAGPPEFVGSVTELDWLRYITDAPPPMTPDPMDYAKRMATLLNQYNIAGGRWTNNWSADLPRSVTAFHVAYRGDAQWAPSKFMLNDLVSEFIVVIYLPYAHPACYVCFAS